MTTMADYIFALKEYYIINKPEESFYKNNPVLALMPKVEKFEGKNLPIPIVTSRPQGVSSTFSVAQANASQGTSGEEFLLTQIKEYGITNIQNQLIQNTKSNMGAFLNAATKEVDFMYSNFSYRVGWKIFGDGYGVMGQVGTITGAGPYVITLLNIRDIYKFAQGQFLYSSSAVSGTVPTNLMQVTKINRGIGQITVALLTGAAPSVNHYIFTQGDYCSTLNTPINLMGLSGWIPDTDPTNTLFFNVDRTLAITELSGVRYNANGAPIEEAIVDLCTEVYTTGTGFPTHVALNPLKWTELAKSQQTRVMYDKARANLKDIELYFETIKVMTPHGPVDVVADRNMPINKYYALQLEESIWTLYSNGAVPRSFDTDGQEMLRVANDDAIEVRAYAYFNLACHNPGANGVGFF